MRSLPGRLGLAVLALVLGAARTARADLVHWTYSWTPGASTITADNVPGGGNVSLSPEGLVHATGSSDVVATNLHLASGASIDAPDTFSTKAYSLTLTITDTDTKATGSLTFTGLLGGSFSAQGAHVTNSFTGLLTQPLNLGGDMFQVTIGPYTPPGPPTTDKLGSIGAVVTATQGCHTAHTPEPATLVLAGFGLTLLGGTWWVRRRGREPSAAAV